MNPLKSLVIVSTIVLFADSCSEFGGLHGDKILAGSIVIIGAFFMVSVFLRNKNSRS